MAHRHLSEAPDKTLRDVIVSNELLGGKLILLSGVFRHFLPVARKGNRRSVVHASIINPKCGNIARHIN